MAINRPSLKSLKLGDPDEGRCTLAGCHEVSFISYACNRCCKTPTLEFTCSPEDICYCSKAHKQEDSVAHQVSCNHRLWLRTAQRVAKIHYKLMLIMSEETYMDVLADYTEPEYAERKLYFRASRKPKDEEPFCAADVDEDTRLCALSFHNCQHSVVTSTGFLAYIRKDLQLDITEVYAEAKPKVAVRLFDESGKEEEVRHVRHTVLHLAPTFLARQDNVPVEATIASNLNSGQVDTPIHHGNASHLTREQIPDPVGGGIVLDSTYAQYAFDNYYDSWELYFRNKIDQRHIYVTKFGSAYRHNHRKLADKPDINHLYAELMFHVVNDTLFEVIQRWGGTKQIFESDEETFLRAESILAYIA